MVKRDNVSQPNCESDGRAENKTVTKSSGLAYPPSECQEQVISINFPCASENVSCQ